MHITFATIFLALAVAAAVPVAASPASRVYKVDAVSAAIEHGKLVVRAHGAVRSGGWQNPRLQKIRSADAGTIALQFAATAPPPDAMVIQAILPVDAVLELPRPRTAIVAIKVFAETNNLSAPIAVRESKATAPRPRS